MLLSMRKKWVLIRRSDPGLEPGERLEGWMLRDARFAGSSA
jgi:hypothetical protein